MEKMIYFENNFLLNDSSIDSLLIEPPFSPTPSKSYQRDPKL